MPQVLQLGRFAESDALFSLFVAASLMVWHAGYTRRWPPACVWGCGYLLAALAALTKGPQGPVYFLAPVLVYLLVRRDWRYLLSLPHVAGVAVFAAVIGAWQIPFLMRAGLEATLKVWSEEGNLFDRIRDILGGALPSHMVTYPVQLLLYVFPWSVMLSVFASRRFRQSLRAESPHVTFLAVWFLVVFPTCWLVPGARARYLMSVYPCLACLVGLAIQRCGEPGAADGWRKLWMRLLGMLAVGMAAMGAAALAVGVYDLAAEAKLLPPAFVTIAYGLICLGLAAACFRTRHATAPLLQTMGVFSAALFLGLTYNGPMVNGDAVRRRNGRGRSATETTDPAGRAAGKFRCRPPPVRLSLRRADRLPALARRQHGLDLAFVTSVSHGWEESSGKCPSPGSRWRR